MQTTTVINAVSTNAILALTLGELTAHTVEAAKEFASFQEKGCKYLGLLRARLHQLKVSSADSFNLIVNSLKAGGMDEARAKSAVNNGKGHSELALFLLREDGGVAIEASRFYAVSVRDSKAVAALLKQGDEFVRQFNRLRLKDGKLNLKSFLPKEDKSAAVEVTPTATVEDSKPTAAVEDSKPTAVEDSPRLAVAKAIASLTKLLPLLEGKDKDDAISALAKLIG
jgi:predicted DNA-binding WGR domain protein